VPIKRYFLLSALPIWLFYYLIWSPSPSLSTNGLFIHLMICYLLLYTFWTVLNIPYYSLGMELTPEYHERSRLFAGRQGFSVAGIVAGTLAPVFFARIAGSKAVGYPWMAIAVGGACVALILIMFFIIEERRDSVKIPAFPFLKGLGVTFRRTGDGNPPRRGIYRRLVVHRQGCHRTCGLCRPSRPGDNRLRA